MKIKYAISKFKINDRIEFRDIEKLRGNVINKFSDKVSTHNHYENGKSIYTFPEVQYKIIDNNLSMMLFNENIELILKIYNEINEIKLVDKIYTEIDKNLEIKEFNIRFLENEYIEYRFISNYLPFNQKNYIKFLKDEYSIEKAITNNILEFLTGVGIILHKDQIIDVKDVKIIKKTISNNKNVKFISFKLSFKTNISLPNYISLGKRKSVGFGVIKRNEANNSR